MVIKGKTLAEEKGRKPYPLTVRDVPVGHFVIRVTTPGNPFRSHSHEEKELWYVIEGEALVSLDGVDHKVEGGDLVELAPWVEHGLRTDTQVTWICLG